MGCILHFGNFEFSERNDSNEGLIAVSSPSLALQKISKFLGLSTDDLLTGFTKQKLITARKSVQVKVMKLLLLIFD
jgi:myosin heavy subunit